MKKDIIYKDLSYLITGLCFKVHNNLGRFAKEKQYCDLFEEELKKEGIFYKREYAVADIGNRIDFLIEDKIIIEAKAKKCILKDDYY